MYAWTIFLLLAVISDHATANDDRDLAGKVAVVTGAANGIGYAIAEHYLKAGVRNLTIVDKDLPNGLKAERTFNALYDNRVMFMHADVTKDLNPVSDIVYKKFGYVDVLVNDAGILNEDDPVNTVVTNLVATMLWTEKFYDVMRKDNGGKGGTIMNLASISSVSKDPFYWFYKGSKFGVLGFTYGIGHEYNYLSTGVRIFAICPGFTHTKMTAQQMVIDEQVVVYAKLKEVVTWQQPDALGKGAVALFKTATTGMAYTIVGGEVYPTPNMTITTAEYLLSL